MASEADTDIALTVSWSQGPIRNNEQRSPNTNTEDIAPTVSSSQGPIRNNEQHSPNTNTEEIEASESTEDPEFKKNTTSLRRRLKLYFYSAVKYDGHDCSFHFVYFLFMILQIAKLSCITAQMFNFGDERENFNNVAKRGHMTLKNLLLKDWDASWETPPYPPANGDFAVYDIKSFKEKINFAIENLYNAEEDAIGYYKRPKPDSVTAEMKYFDFGGFEDGDTFHGLSVKTKIFHPHVSNHTDPHTNETRYSYDVDKDFQLHNLTEPIKRMLTFTLLFKIDSVRVYLDRNNARCLIVNGKISFEDPENNGQVIIDLETTTERQICIQLGYDVPDVMIETVSKSLIVAVLVLAFISLAYTVICIAFGCFVFSQTKRYMKNYYVRCFEPEAYKRKQNSQGTSTDNSVNEKENSKKDLPWKEYSRFIKFWDLLVLSADLTTIIGDIGILELQADEKWTVAGLDTFTILIGIGCLFAWIGLLRYFKFNYKFHLLFNTMYASAGDVLAYLTCICVLFIGYMSFGYVVFGPYHIKFETASSTAETLFSLINGDEIYATFALLQSGQTGRILVPLIYKIYLGSFISVFTIIVLNLLIALFTNAYDAIKQRHCEERDDTEEGPVETALKKILIDAEEPKTQMRNSVVSLLESDIHELSHAEANLRRQLERTVRFSETKGFILKRPKTIKGLMSEKYDEPQDKRAEPKRKPKRCCCLTCCCVLSCFFGFCGIDEKYCSEEN